MASGFPAQTRTPASTRSAASRSAASTPQLVEWAKDQVDENGDPVRPSEFKEEFQFGRMEPLPF